MNQYTGSNFDDFLEQEGILEEVSAKAHKRLLALQLADIMQESNLTVSIKINWARRGGKTCPHETTADAF
jgi:hypothetical protein